MKRTLFPLLLALMTTLSVRAQIPYMAETVGNGYFYAYTSVKFRPGHNAMENYTNIAYGIGNHMQVGLDLYLSGIGQPSIDWGYTFRFNAFSSNYFSIGGQETVFFNLLDSHRFKTNQFMLILSGSFTPNGRFKWTSNTFWYWARSGEHTFEQNWNIGYNFALGEKGGNLCPMIGCAHSWQFEQVPTPAAGLVYNYKWLFAYLWCDRWFSEDPRVVIGLEFIIPTI